MLNKLNFIYGCAAVLFVLCGININVFAHIESFSVMFCKDTKAYPKEACAITVKPSTYTRQPGVIDETKYPPVFTYKSGEAYTVTYQSFIDPREYKEEEKEISKYSNYTIDGNGYCVESGVVSGMVISNRTAKYNPANEAFSTRVGVCGQDGKNTLTIIRPDGSKSLIPLLIPQGDWFRFLKADSYNIYIPDHDVLIMKAESGIKGGLEMECGSKDTVGGNYKQYFFIYNGNIISSNIVTRSVMKKTKIKNDKHRVTEEIVWGYDRNCDGCAKTNVFFIERTDEYVKCGGQPAEGENAKGDTTKTTKFIAMYKYEGGKIQKIWGEKDGPAALKALDKETE